MDRIKAAEDNQLKMAEFLLEKGSYVDAQDRDGDTVVRCAVIQGNLNIVTLLMNHHANPNIENIKGKSALSFARNQTNSYGNVVAPFNRILEILNQNV